MVHLHISGVTTVAVKLYAKLYATNCEHECVLLQVRLHVAGTGSTLDRTLRGVEMAAAPAWLKLPPGEHVERSYACALYSLVGKYRGALHVCREILLFAGYENKYRTIVRSVSASSCYLC